MRWEAKGVNRDSGEDVVITIEADNEASAQRRANRAGLMVESVRPLDPDDSVVGQVMVARPVQAIAPPMPPVAAHPAYQQINVNLPTPHKGASVLGIVATIFGGLALLIAWIPWLGIVAIPLAALGGFLALIGLIVSLAGRQSGVSLPIVGGCLCVLAILIQVFMTAAASSAVVQAANTAAAQRQRTNQTIGNSVLGAGQSRRAVPGVQEWADVSTPVSQGDVTVIVRAVTVGKVPITTIGGDTESKDVLLAIKLDIRNTSANLKRDYSTWRGQGFGASGLAKLTDDAGNTYKRIAFGFADKIADAVESNESIYPGKSITDVLVFEVPVDSAANLRLELPARNFGGNGQMRIQIPMTFVKRLKP